MTPDEKATPWYLNSGNSQKELFSELHVLLKALDRFFFIENLPVSQDDLANKNFYEELNVVRDVIFRVLDILEEIMPESRKNAYWFQRFAESKLPNDHARDIMKENLYKQDSPEKGEYLLYDLFVSLKGIFTDLLDSYQVQSKF